jgi:hypothetical protein
MPNLETDLPVHNRALADQARTIRLIAQKLERLAQTTTDLNRDPSLGQVAVRRGLGEIRAILDALFARFGTGDR